MSATGRPVADGDRRPRVEQDVEWRWVPGYEGIYFVTSDGRLFSFYSRGKKSGFIDIIDTVIAACCGPPGASSPLTRSE